jgi:hypothetical protein
MYASNSSPCMSGVRFLWIVPIHGNLSLALTKSKQAPTPERSLGNQRQTDPVVVSGDLIPPPMRYHQHVIDTFNTCSWGPTEQSLTDTGGSYNLGGAGLPHTHSSTFLTSCLRFPLKAPPDLHFNQVPVINQSFEFEGPMAATWSFDHSAIYRSLHLRLAIANDLSLEEGSQG